MAKSKLLSRTEAAARLGISLRTIGAMISANQRDSRRGLKSVKLGRLRKIPEAEIHKIETARRNRVIF